MLGATEILHTCVYIAAQLIIRDGMLGTPASVGVYFDLVVNRAV